MTNKDIVKGVIEDLQLMKEDDLPFSKCDEDCEDCENICVEYFREDAQTQVEVLHRMAKREYFGYKPELRSVAAITVVQLCDIFGWTDILGDEK